MMNSPHGITEDASHLLDWTFKNYSALSPVGALVKSTATAPQTASEPNATRKASAGTALPRRSRTVLAPGQAVQALVFRVPVWFYAAPPVLFMGLFLRRPRALRVHTRRLRARRH
jgi:D-alanyl-D-alanine carboxypeptidase (penicillin-binding protein 5/6)